jgi:hypothetical protein
MQGDDDDINDAVALRPDFRLDSDGNSDGAAEGWLREHTARRVAEIAARLGPEATVTTFRDGCADCVCRLDSEIGRRIAIEEWGERLIAFGAPGRAGISIRPRPASALT